VEARIKAHYIGTKSLKTITKADIENFQVEIQNGIEPATVNFIVQQVGGIFNWAIENELTEKNPCVGIKKLKVEETKRELFTLAEIKNIFSYDNYNYNAKEVFKILLYTGMRINEFYNLKKENFKNKDGIDYIEVTTSKTKNGLREIPIHKEIKKNLERFDFNEIHKMDASSFSKKILYELYRVIKKGDKKTLHTFRKNFANQIINKYPDHIELFQEILGHSQGSKSLSLQTYGKGFNLENKKILIDSLEFDINFEY
jgi:integrase